MLLDLIYLFICLRDFLKEAIHPYTQPHNRIEKKEERAERKRKKLLDKESVDKKLPLKFLLPTIKES